MKAQPALLRLSTPPYKGDPRLRHVHSRETSVKEHIHQHIRQHKQSGQFPCTWWVGRSRRWAQPARARSTHGRTDVRATAARRLSAPAAASSRPHQSCLLARARRRGSSQPQPSTMDFVPLSMIWRERGGRGETRRRLTRVPLCARHAGTFSSSRTPLGGCTSQPVLHAAERQRFSAPLLPPGNARTPMALRGGNQKMYSMTCTASSEGGRGRDSSVMMEFTVYRLLRNDGVKTSSLLLRLLQAATGLQATERSRPGLPGGRAPFCVRAAMAHRNSLLLPVHSQSTWKRRADMTGWSLIPARLQRKGERRRRRGGEQSPQVWAGGQVEQEGTAGCGQATNAGGAADLRSRPALRAGRSAGLPTHVHTWRSAWPRFRPRSARPRPQSARTKGGGGRCGRTGTCGGGEGRGAEGGWQAWLVLSAHGARGGSASTWPHRTTSRRFLATHPSPLVARTPPPEQHLVHQPAQHKHAEDGGQAAQAGEGGEGAAGAPHLRGWQTRCGAHVRGREGRGPGQPMQGRGGHG